MIHDRGDLPQIYALEIPALTYGEVHLWSATLDRASSEIRALWTILAPDERSKAERFLFALHRDRFVAGRGLLRTILSGYLRCLRHEPEFVYGPFGKPALSDKFKSHALQFNLSHSDGMAVFALARTRAVGCDIERIRPDPGVRSSVSPYLSAREREALNALPAEMQLQAFFSCWTRKEAYLKATGQGLSFPLDQFDVTVNPAEPAAIIRVAGKPLDASRWSMMDLSIGSEYAGAICVQGDGWEVRRMAIG